MSSIFKLLTILSEQKSGNKALTFTAIQPRSTVYILKKGTVNTDGIQYKLNNNSWKTYELNQIITLTNVGDYVQFQDINPGTYDNDNYRKFVLTGKIAASGNVMSMLNYQEQCRAFCFAYLFANGASLITAPELPATTLADRCYFSMFASCTNLITAPELPAITLENAAYRLMFQNCTSLIAAPELPATTLTSNCYTNMFQNCTSLITAPELPATTLTNYCYKDMFSNCKSLIAAPELPATTLTYQCYMNMFSGCSKLNFIKVAFKSWHSNATTDWVSNVSSTGTFICPEELPKEYGTSKIPESWRVLSTNEATPLTFTATKADAEVFMRGYGDVSISDIEYKLNDGNWQEYTFTPSYNEETKRNEFTGELIILEQPGNYVQFRNNNTQLSKNTNEYVRFKLEGEGDIDASGNVMSMLNFSDTIPAYGLYGLFYKGTSLNSTPEIYAKTIGRRGCGEMFDACTNLTKTMTILPATVGYSECYHAMFRNCTSLQKASIDISSLSINGNDICMRMFENCSSLQQANEIKLPDGISAWTYYRMFAGCSSLIAAPELPAAHLLESCYRQMFENCSNLRSISASFEDWNGQIQSTTNWVKGVNTIGNFYCKETLYIKYGTNNIPYNWTVNAIL